jgi:hypothetical protein
LKRLMFWHDLKQDTITSVWLFTMGFFQRIFKSWWNCEKQLLKHWITPKYADEQVTWNAFAGSLLILGRYLLINIQITNYFAMKDTDTMQIQC